MDIILITRGEEHKKILLWCLDNLSDDAWRTINKNVDSFDGFGKRIIDSSLQWLEPNDWRELMDREFNGQRCCGVYWFKNSKDAMLFKLKWG